MIEICEICLQKNINYYKKYLKKIFEFIMIILNYSCIYMHFNENIFILKYFFIINH